MHRICDLSVPRPRPCDSQYTVGQTTNNEKSLTRTCVRCNSHHGSLNYERKEQTSGVSAYIDRLGLQVSNRWSSHRYNEISRLFFSSRAPESLKGKKVLL
jgi:hypothetical protein